MSYLSLLRSKHTSELLRHQALLTQTGMRLPFPFPGTGKIQGGEIQPFSAWDVRNATLELEIMLADNRAPETLLWLISLNWSEHCYMGWGNIYLTGAVSIQITGKEAWSHPTWESVVAWIGKTMNTAATLGYIWEENKSAQNTLEATTVLKKLKTR